MKQHTKPSILSASFAASLLIEICCVAHADEYRYAVFDLGDFGGDAANAFGINDDGTVVGCAWFPGNRVVHPALFSTDRPPVDLGTFGGSEGTCYDINNVGVITGFAHDELDRARAFLFENDVLHELGTLGGNGSIAHSINEYLSIVGFSSLPSHLTHAFLWTAGQMNDLGSLYGDSRSSDAWDINESGLIVGYSSDFSGWQTAVYWEPDGAIHRLAWLGGVSIAYAVNDLGYIVGKASYSNGGEEQVLWDLDGMIHILRQGQPEIAGGQSWGINNKNQIVGFAGVFGRSDNLAFIWEQDTGIRILEDLSPPIRGMTIPFAHDINEHGQIAAWGEQFKTHWYRALLLTPVDPELALSEPVPGIAGETNTWTITGAQPGSKIIFTYSLKGGGTVVPGCDKLDAVLQLNNPKIMRSAIANANGEATIEMFVPAQARNTGDILFQAVSVKDCEESQLVVFEFE